MNGPIDVWCVQISEGVVKSILFKPSVDRDTAIRVSKAKIKYPNTISIIFKRSGSYFPKHIFKNESEILEYENKIKS
jgi:hypothetical protein